MVASLSVTDGDETYANLLLGLLVVGRLQLDDSRSGIPVPLGTSEGWSSYRPVY